MNEKPRVLGCLGWILLLVGIVIFARHHWMAVWDWGFLILGALLLINGITGKDRKYLFPATIMLITFGALVLYRTEIIVFPLWKIWPVLFISTGLGFLLLYIFHEAKTWVFIPAGFLLFTGSVGLGYSSWWRYLRWLRDVVDLWPMLLIALGVFILVGRWRRHSEKPASLDILSSHSRRKDEEDFGTVDQ